MKINIRNDNNPRRLLFLPFSCNLIIHLTALLTIKSITNNVNEYPLYRVWEFRV